MTTPTQSDKDRVVIFDTTLRDGEQCPGATMTHEEKLEVAELLDQMGVDSIEAGFPIASDRDFAAVQEIAKRTKNAVVCGLSRAAFKDIHRCAEAIKPARRSRIHTFLSTSPVHMIWKLQMDPESARTGACEQKEFFAMSTPSSEKDRVYIFDTTLRDGEQSPGATMTHEEKLEVAELLD